MAPSGNNLRGLEPQRGPRTQRSESGAALAETKGGISEDSNLGVGLAQDAKRVFVPGTQEMKLSGPLFTHVIASLQSAKPFPCSVSSLWRFSLHYHPSTQALRPVYNGDTLLEVGAGSA